MKNSCAASVVALAALCVFGTACAKKKVVAKTPPAPAASASSATPAVAPSNSQEAPQAAEKVASNYPDAATRARIDELLARIQDAYFDYNRHNLRPDAIQTLNADAKELAQILQHYPDYKLRVEGYCDERGSSEYNMALGDARAKAAKEYLVGVGVPSDQLSTVSFGKEKQICSEHDENCWSKNRRVHIFALARD